MTWVIESVVYWTVFSDVSMKLAAVHLKVFANNPGCLDPSLWEWRERLLGFDVLAHLVIADHKCMKTIQKDWLENKFGLTQMHHTPQLHPADVLTVQSLTLLCLRAYADKPCCLPLYLFHNHFFSLMVLWPMLHLPYNISSCLSGGKTRS